MLLYSKENDVEIKLDINGDNLCLYIDSEPVLPVLEAEGDFLSDFESYTALVAKSGRIWLAKAKVYDLCSIIIPADFQNVGEESCEICQSSSDRWNVALLPEKGKNYWFANEKQILVVHTEHTSDRCIYSWSLSKYDAITSFVEEIDGPIPVFRNGQYAFS